MKSKDTEGKLTLGTAWPTWPSDIKITLIDLPVGAADLAEANAFYSKRWVQGGREGQVVVLAKSTALRRTYGDNAILINGVRVRRVAEGIEADRFSLDLSELSEWAYEEEPEWLPVLVV